MGPFHPPQQQNNAKNATIFFLLTLVVFALPLFLPSSSKTTSKAPVGSISTAQPSTSNSPGPIEPSAVGAAVASPANSTAIQTPAPKAATPSATPSANTEKGAKATATPQPRSSELRPSPGPTQGPGQNSSSSSSANIANIANIASSASPTPKLSVSPSPADSPSASPSASPEAAISAAQTPQAGATPGEPDWRTDQGPQIDFKAKLQSVILNLLLITGLVFVTVKLLQKYYVPNLAARQGPKPLIEVLATTPIGPTTNLCLVQVCNKTMVLAMTEHSVTTVCEISPEDLEAARQGNSTEVVAPVVALTKTPQQVYGDILRHYLSIIPGFGEKK